MVIIVDLLLIDHMSNRALFFIERFGNHTIDIADACDIAVDMLKEKVYDIIFIGGKLSVGHGSDVAEWLSRQSDNENNKSTIVIHSQNLIDVEFSIRALPNSIWIPFEEDTYSTLNL